MIPTDFIHDLRPTDVPADVLHQARRCLLDLVGVAINGRRTDAGRIACDHAARHFGAGEGHAARAIFDGRPVSPVGAAFAGATLIDSFDAHDGHYLTKGHAGVAVLPALLAVWDAEGLALDEDAVLTALVLGYEIATRAGIALHASTCDYHTSGAWNALACAAVGSRLLGLDSGRTREALGIAEYNGPRSQMMRCIDHPTMVKDGSGIGAMIGTQAAYLASDGFTGAPAITVEAPDQAPLWSDLGRRWMILEQYFKPYPVCRWAQPAVEAVRHLMTTHDIAGTDVVDVEIRSFAEAVRLATALPTSTDAAQYSLPFPVAAMILRGRLTAEEVTGPGLADAEVLALSARTKLIADPDICARFPAERHAVATLTTRDGRRFTSDWTTAKGGPEAPFADDAILAKFRDLAVLLPEARSRALETILTDFGGDRPASGLLDLILEPVEARA